MPVAFRPDFEPQQRLYFALDAMGLVEKLHAKVFYAVHVEKNRLACTGAPAGPSLYHLFAILGRDRVLARMDLALARMTPP